jgi:hypothetical protein
MGSNVKGSLKQTMNPRSEYCKGGRWKVEAKKGASDTCTNISYMTKGGVGKYKTRPQHIGMNLGI